jgi:putative ABC transport system ATP-binding protein
LLTVQGLHRQLPDAPKQGLLTDIDLRVDAGRCAVISGSSGAGKTLLLRSLVDLDPCLGQVILNSDLRETIPAPVWRQRLCYVPAEPAWWSETTRDHFPDLDKAHDLAAVLDLDAALFGQPVSRLSTGERQRLALVRALSLSPEVLLLDEPTSALGSRSTERVEDALRRFMQAGKSIVLVTHDAAQGKRMGNDFYVMAEGHLRHEQNPA